MLQLEKARCVVLLTFDFDAESAEVRKTPHLPVTLSKGQFGVRVGIHRILDLLDSYRIRATFFTPTWTIEHYPEETRELCRRGHEVSAHGDLHENFSELSEEEEWGIHCKAFNVMKTVLGIRPVGFRAPYWEWSSRTLTYLQKCGFRYDSSLMSDDKPYVISIGGASTGIHELPVEWSLDDWPLFEIQRRNPSDVLSMWKSEFDAVYDQGIGYFMVTMHPECIGRAPRMVLLKQLIEHVLQRNDVVFARCDELVESLTRTAVK
jgi:peptidoglycan/xylan/chitin deacetylase (PgdA/CDA1 family)